jgi:hypothetical protein
MSRSSSLMLCISLLALFSSPLRAGDGVNVIYPREDRRVAAALEATARTTYFGPLREVLESIAKDKHIPILLDEVSLQQIPAAMSDVVDYDVEDIDPVRAQLDGLDLEQGPTIAAVLAYMFQRHAISYVVEDGVLKIMTAADAERKKLIRAYDVSSMTHSTTSIETLAKTVSSIASGLKPAAIPRILEGGQDKVDPGQPEAIRVSAYKKTLVCLGSKSEQDRVAKAIAFLRELESE